MTDQRTLSNSALSGGGGSAMGIGASLSILIVWAAELAGLPMTAEVGGALAGIIGYVISRWTG